MGDDAKSEKDYYDTYLALKAKKEFIDLPRDHAAQKYKDNWAFMAVQPEMPNLMLYMAKSWCQNEPKLVSKRLYT